MTKDEFRMTNEAPMTETTPTSRQARRPGVFGAEGLRQHLTLSSPNYPAGLGAFAGQNVITLGKVGLSDLSHAKAQRRKDSQRLSGLCAFAPLRETSKAFEHTRPTSRGFVIPSSFAIRHSSFQRGSALIAVFWMIFALGMVLFAATKALHGDTEYTRMMRGRIYAKRYAETGLELARHPAMQQDDPLLHFSSDIGGGFDVTLKTEEARLNINFLLQSGDKILLRRLFTRWGFKPEFTTALCDALKDWVDADSNASLNGAEKREYQKAGLEGMPFNQPFKEVEDMLHVRGMDIVNAERPDWREWFTVYGDGRIDINDTSAEIISLLGDVPMERVQPILTMRNGRDGQHRTRDDMRLGSVPQVAQMLGVFNRQTVAQLTQWIQFTGPIRRIESVGYLGPLKRKLILITQGGQAVWRGEIPIHGQNS
jgi:general secretion pathway protein K